jgi:hypothetical protein
MTTVENVESYSSPNGATYELKSARPSEALLQRRLKNKIYCIEDSLLFKRCSRCKEYWPADTEFFYSVKDDDGLNQWCKACYQEWRYPNGRKESKSQKQGAAA